MSGLVVVARRLSVGIRIIGLVVVVGIDSYSRIMRLLRRGGGLMVRVLRLMTAMLPRLIVATVLLLRVQMLRL